MILVYVARKNFIFDLDRAQANLNLHLCTLVSIASRSESDDFVLSQVIAIGSNLLVAAAAILSFFILVPPISKYQEFYSEIHENEITRFYLGKQLEYIIQH